LAASGKNKKQKKIKSKGRGNPFGGVENNTSMTHL
jgi:hypothetical protein